VPRSIRALRYIEAVVYNGVVVRSKLE